MRPEELKKRLKKLDRRLDMVIYRRKEDQRVHMNMCSVMYKGEHLCSMSNNFIPRFQRLDYKPPGSRVPYRSVFGLAQSLYKSRIITKAESKTLYL